MIRINLVDPGQRAEKKKRISFALPEGQQVPALGGLMLLVAALIVAWWYWDSAQTDSALNAEIAAAQQQEAQLAQVLQEVQTFETRRQQLQQRVALIDELRRGQSVPVHIIDQVSRALPDGMWLTRLQQKGVEISVDGECLSLTALSDFVGNLAESRYFTRPVEIIDSEVIAARENLPEVIRFSVKATFQMGGTSQENAAPKPAVPPPPAGGTGG